MRNPDGCVLSESLPEEGSPLKYVVVKAIGERVLIGGVDRSEGTP